MTRELTDGALAAIMAGGQVESPVMQILGSKKISGAGDNERYRLLISDGTHVNSFAMLATQLNEKIRNGELSDYSIVRIKRFITSIVPNSGRGEKRVMIILDVEIVAPGSEVGTKIGNPQTLNADGQVQNVPKPEPPEPAAQAPPPPAARATAPSLDRSPLRPAASNHAGFGGGYGSNIRSPNQNRGMGGMELNQTPSIFPIASLSPYQNKWAIKARVTFKSQIRHWNNKSGEGKLFSFDLVDETGEIRVTAFKEQCDKFFDIIEVDKVYVLSRGSLKTANKKFTNLNNDYEITLNSESHISLYMEDDASVPKMKFNFKKLCEVEALDSNAIIDVIGVATHTGDVMSFMAKTTNREFKKREVTVVDDSNCSVNITLWGDQAENFDGSSHPLIAVKGGKINEFGGAKSVSVSHNSVLQINPDIAEAHKLRGWYDDVGHKTTDVKCLSARTGGAGGVPDGTLITLKEARTQGLGCGDKPDYFSCKATVLLIKSENSMYKACPGENCLKKVLDQNNGLYRCEKCNREFTSFVPRLMLSMSIGDWSDQQWVTLFQENAETLLGQDAQTLHDWKENQDEKYLQTFQQPTFKSFQFRLRIKAENYNDEKRIKMSVFNLKPVDHKAYSKHLLSQLKDLIGMGTVSH